jgi:hypothetical protein
LEQQTADSKQQTANSKQQTVNSRLQTADCKQQAANRWVSVSEFLALWSLFAFAFPLSLGPRACRPHSNIAARSASK